MTPAGKSECPFVRPNDAVEKLAEELRNHNFGVT